MSLKALEARANLKGYAPANDMTHVVPEGFVVKGVSTLYDGNGRIGAQWVKSKLDPTFAARVMHAAADAAASEMPRLPPLEGPRITMAKLCNVYTITDFHLGMFATVREGGDDWNMEIAEKTLIAMFEEMIRAAPVSRVAIINQLGDLLHFDGLLPITPTSGHILDASANYSELVRVAIRVLRRVIDIALMKHDEVHVVMAEGNHDMASSVWLRLVFAALYENDPRVTVNDNDLPYYAYQHGNVFLGFHHGHKAKKQNLPLLFAAMFRKIFGDTTKGYIHTGHEHHVEEKEHPGFKLVQHPTMAARDAYAARGGWMSERECTVETYHEDFGRVARNTVTPEMLALAA